MTSDNLSLDKLKMFFDKLTLEHRTWNSRTRLYLIWTFDASVYCHLSSRYLFIMAQNHSFHQNQKEDHASTILILLHRKHFYNLSCYKQFINRCLCLFFCLKKGKKETILGQHWSFGWHPAKKSFGPIQPTSLKNYVPNYKRAFLSGNTPDYLFNYESWWLINISSQ